MRFEIVVFDASFDGSGIPRVESWEWLDHGYTTALEILNYDLRVEQEVYPMVGLGQHSSITGRQEIRLDIEFYSRTGQGPRFSRPEQPETPPTPPAPKEEAFKEFENSYLDPDSEL